MVKRNFEEVPGLREKWERENMMGRLATPEEFKGAGLFLLSKASSFMVRIIQFLLPKTVSRRFRLRQSGVDLVDWLEPHHRWRPHGLVKECAFRLAAHSLLWAFPRDLGSSILSNRHWSIPNIFLVSSLSSIFWQVCPFLILSPWCKSKVPRLNDRSTLLPSIMKSTLLCKTLCTPSRDTRTSLSASHFRLADATIRNC